MRSLGGPHPTHRVGTALMLIAGLVGLLALSGWLLGVPALTVLGLGPRAVRPNSAACLLLLASAALLSGGPARAARVGRGLALGAGGVGLVTAAEHALSVSWAFDEWLATVPGPEAAARMTLPTTACVLSLCVVRLLPDRWRRRAGEPLALLAVVIAFTSVVGYAYSVDAELAIGPYQPMALPTALAAVALAGAELLAVPDGATAWLVAGRSPGTALVRRLFPALVLGVPLLGWLLLEAREAGLYDPAYELAMLASSAVVTIGVAAWATARHLDRADEGRQRALAELSALNASLEEQVRDRAGALEAARGRYAVLDDRQRIAADLHDHVIQGLYGVALGLDHAARTSPDRDLLSSAAVGIDASIRELRGAIHELKRPDGANDLADRLAHLVDTAAQGSQVPCVLACTGSLELVSSPVAENLVASAREAVSNALRHAGAETVAVEVTVTGDEVALTVGDDGRGLPPGTESTSGMRNIRTRAEQHGGSCDWLPNQPRGTLVRWRSPLAPPTPELDLGQAPLPVAPDVPPGQRSRTAAADDLVAVVTEVARGLVADGGPAGPGEPVDFVALRAMRLAGADGMSVVVEDGDRLRFVAAGGSSSVPGIRGMDLPRAGSVTAYVIESGRMLRVDDVTDLPASVRFMNSSSAYGPALILPVCGPGRTGAALMLVREKGRPAFTGHDVRRARLMAPFVTLALELELPAAAGR